MTDEVDNCPLVVNPDQANCNVEAERAWNATNPANVAVKLLGDACDPVPCPKESTDAVTKIASSQCFPPRRDPSANQVCVADEIHDLIQVTPVGSHAVSQVDGVTRSPVEHEVKDVATHGRFCEKVPLLAGQHAVDCTSANILSDDQLRLTVSAESDVFDPSHPWHRITLKNANPLIESTSGGYAFIEPAPRNSKHALAMDRASSLSFSPATLESWTELLQ